MTDDLIDPDLLERIDRAFGRHDPTPRDRAIVINALEGGATTWEKMPLGARVAIERTEKLPPTSWDDPSEVPGNAPLTEG